MVRISKAPPYSARSRCVATQQIVAMVAAKVVGAAAVKKTPLILISITTSQASFQPLTFRHMIACQNEGPLGSDTDRK